jgi:NAD(P)-dependent dehydrogenase (short-subunit alcohol dehydrogenase family)
MSALLQNKSALVTGASKGIGKATAERLAKDGAFVIVNYAHDKEGAENTVKAIVAKGGKGVALQGDISTVAGIQKLFAEIDGVLKKENFKTLDILVNNAGVYPMGTLEETTEADFDRTFAVNVKGLFFTTQEAVKRMGQGGRIINISTTLTRVGSNSMLAYSASKGAVDIFTRDMALALGPKGITVNAVNPGLIRTEGTAGTTASNETVKYFAENTALGRIGEPDDIAGVIAFLANDNARWITAQNIEASGGYHL